MRMSLGYRMSGVKCSEQKQLCPRTEEKGFEHPDGRYAGDVGKLAQELW